MAVSATKGTVGYLQLVKDRLSLPMLRCPNPSCLGNRGVQRRSPALEDAQALVVGAKVVAPLADAVRLVTATRSWHALTFSRYCLEFLYM